MVKHINCSCIMSKKHTVCPLFVKHCFRYHECSISCFHEKAYFVVSRARAKFREVIGRLERVGHIDPENLGGRCEDMGFDSGNWDLQGLCATFNDLLVLFYLFFFFFSFQIHPIG